MSPEERQEFEDLQRKVEDLSRPENAMKIERVIFNDDLVVDNTQVERTASVSGGGGGNVDVMDYPDRWIVMRHGTKAYIIPAYDFTRLDN
uniref:Uncharacterized protein n=1 Tax=uncultured marine virus TaxID=186617 RepID=A0A0F7L9G5_9VIRU|nr:hypothetical protein [uncultured marine virus]